MSRCIIRKREVIKKTGLSGSTIWRLQQAGKFPQSVKLTDDGSAVGWFDDEVDEWTHERVRAGGKRPSRGGVPA